MKNLQEKTAKFFSSDESVFFTTREFAHILGIQIESASRKLHELAHGEAVVKVARGVWANPGRKEFSPLRALPYLLGGAQGYVSFLSALHLHGVISQIPQTHQIAFTGVTRNLITPIGTYEFHQMKPTLMQKGVEFRHGYRMANAEKALVDTVYLSIKKKNQFQNLPELEFSRSTARKKYIEEYTRMITPMAAQRAVRQRIQTLMIRN